jgi:oxygen-dependent protoporphyrinogen oxidase
VTAVSFASNKWAHWRPADGSVILRTSLGRDGLVVDDRSDDELVSAALDEVSRHIGVDLAPTAVRLTRWPDAFPQYRPGHMARVDRIESALAADAPGVVVTGAGHRGIGIPACVHQGRNASSVLAERLGIVGQSTP